MNYLFSILIFTFSLTSVAFPQIDFDIGNNTAILLDTTGYSCQAFYTGSTSPDISSVYTVIPKIKVNWNEKNPLTIQWINIDLQSSGLSGSKYNITIGGDALGYSWLGSEFDSANPADIVIDGQNNNSNNCSLKFGGIQISNKSKDLYGDGFITIMGTTRDDSGATRLVTGKRHFDFYFKGSGIKP